MKSSFLKVTTIAALAAVPSFASADYVCSVAHFPGNPTLAYRVRVLFSSGANCTGATNTLWFCEKGLSTTATFCAVDGLRFEKAQLSETFGQLVRAADSQQYVSRATTTCGDNVTQGCGYYVDFSY